MQNDDISLNTLMTIFIILFSLLLASHIVCLADIRKAIIKNTGAIDKCSSAITAIALKDVGISGMLGQTIDGSTTNSFIHSIKIRDL